MSLIHESGHHYVRIEHQNTPTGPNTCRAFCHTCYWRGPKVRFASTAERHGRKHIEQTAAQPAATS